MYPTHQPYQRMAAEFARAIDSPTVRQKSEPLSGAQTLLRLQLMGEELSEYCRASLGREMLEALHELTDLEYVVRGTLISLLWDGDSRVTGLQTLRSRPVRLNAPAHDLSWAGECHSLLSQYTAAPNVAQQTACMEILLRTVMKKWDAVGVNQELHHEIFSAVHSANMAKMGGGTASSGRVIKPPGWQPADLISALERAGYLINLEKRNELKAVRR